jgi:uncharacterized protein DUF4328/uncharacterized protein DUF2510
VSSPTTSPQAPGWYPDPAGADGMRWWDGEDWTGRRSLHPRRERLVPLGPRFARLADLLGALLLANAGFSVLTALIQQVENHEVVARLLAVVALGLVAVTAFFWSAWQWRLAVSSPDELRRTPRGHVVAWFVPVANCWLPIQDLTELWYAYEPHDPNGRGRGISLVLPWWTCWIISAVLGAMGLRTLLSGGTPDAYVNVAWALAAVLAWFVVRRLSWRALVYHAVEA